MDQDDHGVRVEISFYGQKIERCTFVGEHDMELSRTGIFVLIGGEYVSAQDHLGGGRTPIPAIIAEVEQEQADEEAHEREMSSLEKDREDLR